MKWQENWKILKGAHTFMTSQIHARPSLPSKKDMAEQQI